jgi:O-antigen/teichoic acid export membrane protein
MSLSNAADETAESGSPLLGVFAGTSTRARFARGALWSVIGMGAAQGLGFAAYVIAAHLLTKNAFGELGMIQSTVGMFGMFAGMGLGLTATKHIAQFRASSPARAGKLISLSMLTSIGWGFVMSAALWFLADYLALRTFGEAAMAGPLRIGCALLFFSSVGGVQLGILTGMEAFQAIAWTNLVRGSVNIVIVPFGAWVWGVDGAVWGLTVTAVVAAVAGHVAVEKGRKQLGIPAVHRGLSSEVSVLWRFSLPAFLTTAVVSLASWLTRAFLVNRPGGFGELAIVTVSTRFQDALNMVGLTVGAALLPMLASAGSSGTSEELEIANILVSWILGAAAALPLLCFPGAASAIFGPQYTGTDVAQALVLVLVSTVILMYRQGLARTLAANDLMWWNAICNLAWAAIFVAATWWLLPYGARGFTGAMVIAYVASTALFLPLYVRRKLAPMRVLASPRVVAVWAIVVLLAITAWIHLPVLLRSGFLLVSAAGLGVCFVGMLRTNKITVEQTLSVNT